MSNSQLWGDFQEPVPDAERQGIAQTIMEQDTLELLTVGIDIGSSTSHLIFARIHLRRGVHDLSSRFTVVDRTIEWQSPIFFTPFVHDGSIDAQALSGFFECAYRDAGHSSDDVDSGAVILTGEAAKRRNARAIDDLFADTSGKFVCATAGHNLESILAAHGSGAARLSREMNTSVLHVDIGGGTTKFALIDRGNIVSVAAIAVGGRLLASDEKGCWTRIDEPAVVVAKDLGLDLLSNTSVKEEGRRAVARRFGGLVVERILGTPSDALAQELELTAPLERMVEPEYLTMSGGVSEYIYGKESNDYGDIAGILAEEVVEGLKGSMSVQLMEVGHRIRATVIGASQFTVQVSGKTTYMSPGVELPLRNVPVVGLGQPVPEAIEPDDVADVFRGRAERVDRDADDQLALAFTWTGHPTYERLNAMARAIIMFDRLTSWAGVKPTLVVVSDGDVGQALGRMLKVDLGLEREVISIDGINLQELDFVDVGQLIDPPGVVPVVVKSLLFP